MPARSLLLCAPLLTGCQGPPVPVVVRQAVPASLLSCAPQPEAPRPLTDDRQLGNFIVDLAIAGVVGRAPAAARVRVPEFPGLADPGE